MVNGKPVRPQGSEMSLPTNADNLQPAKAPDIFIKEIGLYKNEIPEIAKDFDIDIIIEWIEDAIKVMNEIKGFLLPFIWLYKKIFGTQVTVKDLDKEEVKEIISQRATEYYAEIYEDMDEFKIKN